MSAYTVQTFFRAFSGRDPRWRGALRARLAGNGHDEGKLSQKRLLDAFDLHCDQDNRIRTPLVSVSDRLIDTLVRAFNKHYVDGEEPHKIWIALIEIPEDHSDTLPTIHHAEDLAERCGHPRPWVFGHEFLFEWEIPGEFAHLVTVEELLSRKVDMGRFCGFYDKKEKWHMMDYIEDTQQLRQRMADVLFTQNSVEDVGEFSWSFGPEVAQDVALQLWNDCADCLGADEEETVVFQRAIEQWMMRKSQFCDSDDESEG